jgi:prepilin-type N-terminal cleavage/methylation domain-containing protein/prepilin-type processing-associated H-X9-DG protein
MNTTQKRNVIFRPNSQAFTLIELLVVITIIGILAVLVVPTLGKARRSALRTSCASNLKQVGTAVKMYLLDHNSVFPPLSDGGQFGTLAAFYVPYLNGATEVFRCPAQKNNLSTMPAYGNRFLIPGVSNSSAWVSYEFNTFFAYPSNSYVRTSTKRDAPSPTICAYAYDFPYNPSSAADAPYIPHQSGMNVLYVDWHVSWLPVEEYGLSLPYAQRFYGKGHL